jgi:hypothetical protein
MFHRKLRQLSANTFAPVLAGYFGMGIDDMPLVRHDIIQKSDRAILKRHFKAAGFGVVDNFHDVLILCVMCLPSGQVGIRVSYLNLRLLQLYFRQADWG